MARTTPLTIILERVGDEDIHEAPGAGTIKPGYVCQFQSGGAGTLEACATAGIKNVVVAVENPYDDATSSAAIDSAYVSDDTVRYIFPRPGDLLYMYGSSVTAVEKYTPVKAHSSGGCVTDTNGSAAEILGYAWESKTVTTAARLKVRIV